MRPTKESYQIPSLSEAIQYGKRANACMGDYLASLPEPPRPPQHIPRHICVTTLKNR